MTKTQLAKKALALPLSQRVKLAEALWESIEQTLPEDDEDTRAALELTQRRAQELDSGKVRSLSHTELMERVRRDRK